MNVCRLTALLALVAGLLITLGTVRADDTPANKRDEKHPVNVCIVSGEHLLPGEIVTYIYKVEGQPDRTLRFCCRKCLARFKADPERFLKKLDQLETETEKPNQD
jgi:YHS domain-containing protein